MGLSEMADTLATDIRKTSQAIGLSLDYPHRPIPNALAEALLLGSIMGVRLAPHVTWLLGLRELGNATVGPHQRFDQPERFINRLGPASNPDDWFTASDPAMTDSVNLAAAGTQMLGNAVDLTTQLLSRLTPSGGLANLNLDCDRGYGYKAWDHATDSTNNPFAASTSTAVALRYL